MWIEPIYDRTQADVDLIRLDPTNENTKGAYNYNDLNRIENNCEYIMNLRNSKADILGPVTITVKTNWSVKDIPSITDFNRIRQNIIILMNGIKKTEEIQEIEFTNTMNYIKANILEKDLDIIKNIIYHCEKELYHCNTFFCGANGLCIFAKPIEFINIDIYSGKIYCGEEFRL